MSRWFIKVNLKMRMPSKRQCIRMLLPKERVRNLLQTNQTQIRTQRRMLFPGT